MCDEQLLAHFARSRGITRRRFGTLTGATGAAALWSRSANAVEVTASNVDVPTPDGVADCHFVHPVEAHIRASSSFRMPAACEWSIGEWRRGSPKKVTKRDRVGAGASFHGVQLATDGDDSPHLLVPGMRAGFVFAIAEDDDERDPDVKNLLRDAFDDADLFAEIEVYEGAMHSWTTADSPVHNPEQAERAWSRMFELFERTLKT